MVRLLGGSSDYDAQVGREFDHLIWLRHLVYIDVTVNFEIIFFKVLLLHTLCSRSSDPFYVVTYYKNWSLLPGHIVQQKSSDI